MKVLFEKLLFSDRSSVLVRRFNLPYFDAPWHYHPEYELTYIVSGYGQRFVGDHVTRFQPGDLVLLGPDLPHLWRNDEEFYRPESTSFVESIVVQFPASLDEQVLVALPEAAAVRQLLNRARHGIRFGLTVSNALAEQMAALPQQTGLVQLLHFLTILHQLANDPTAQLLASDSYQLAPGAADTERMKRVLEHVLTHFREEIRIEQIASVAGMVPAAFCRYFKHRTRKTCIEYLNELRIGQARKLLLNQELSVGQVGLECGFNNSSHFHRQFRLHTGLTPLQYQTSGKNK